MENGKHKAKAVAWDLVSSKEGTDGISITFHTDNGDISSAFWFSDKAYEYTIKKMRACGWTGDDLTQLDSLGTNEVEIVVDDDTYQGKTRQVVKFVNGPGDGPIGKMADDKARAFAAKMKSKINALGIVPPAKPGALPF